MLYSPNPVLVLLELLNDDILQVNKTAKKFYNISNSLVDSNVEKNTPDLSQNIICIVFKIFCKDFSEILNGDRTP